MSASVTVSIADERMGMLRGISRVRKVRGSAWLGSTVDSSGSSRTSSNVRPKGILGGTSVTSWSWAISAHDRRTAIRQERRSLVLFPRDHPLRGLHVHPPDHFIA